MPTARRQAQFIAETAAKLSQAQNWTAAAREWQRAADEFGLLNDRTNLATALHNLAHTQRQLKQSALAASLLKQAMALNLETRRTNEWWRNQIAWLQMESHEGQTNALAEDFNRLLPQFANVAAWEIRGLFLNELGLWQTQNTQYTNAAESFQQAELAFVKGGMAAGEAAVRANRAQLLLAQGNYAAAAVEWRRALKGYEVLAEPPGIARCLHGLGETLLAENKNLPEAEAYLWRAAQNYRLLKQSESQVKVQQLLIKCLKEQGKPSEEEPHEPTKMPTHY